ncbi:MAG: hypothetical protein ACXW05_17675 [Gemmatirosa sp.]
MLQFAIVAALLIVALAFAAVSSRTISAAAQRDELGRHRFLSAFNAHRLPAELLVHTYDALTRRTAPADITIGPSTALASDLGLSRIDAEDLALLIAARCNGRIPTAHDLDDLDQRVYTVEDLLHFLHPFVAVPMAA